MSGPSRRWQQGGPVFTKASNNIDSSLNTYPKNDDNKTSPKKEQQDKDEEEDDDDYMSDKFLASLTSSSSSSSPATTAASFNNKKKNQTQELTYSQRRQQQLFLQKSNEIKPLKQRELEQRELGLRTEIGKENKGRQMLEKMGYKLGYSLGTSNQAVTMGVNNIVVEAPVLQDTVPALREPLPIVTKQGRGGLGMETILKRKAEQEMEEMKSRDFKIYMDQGFRGRKQEQFRLEKIQKQLSAARGLCMRMDCQGLENDEKEVKDGDNGRIVFGLLGNVETGNKEWDDQSGFWWMDKNVPKDEIGTLAMGPPAPMVVVVQDLSDATTSTNTATNDAHGMGIMSAKRPFLEDSDDEESKAEKDKRAKTTATSTSTMTTTAGSFRSMTSPTVTPFWQDDSSTGIGDGLDSEGYHHHHHEEPVYRWGELARFAQLEPHEKLEKVVTYLRSQHHYCFWCQVHYTDNNDLEQSCPGPDEDDH